MPEIKKCPSCGSENIDRDEVDVGVGVITGPYGCFNCGWSEDKYWDSSKGPPEAPKDYPGFRCDSRGGVKRIKPISTLTKHIAGEMIRMAMNDRKEDVTEEIEITDRTTHEDITGFPQHCSKD